MNMNTSIKGAIFILLIGFPMFLTANSYNNPESRKNVFFTPGISIGYTFHGGPNIAFSIDAGVKDNSAIENHYGVNYTLRIMRFDGNFHRNRAISLMYENKFIDVKLGAGSTKVRSGYNKIRQCVIDGLIADISVNLTKEQGPKIGYNGFIYKRRRWGYFPTYYHGPYLAYDHKVTFQE